MSTDRMPFFLDLAREWWDVRAALRARGVSAGDPALGVWREAAWCHLMFTAGKHPAAVVRLQALLGEVTGAPVVPFPAEGAEAVSAAADLFVRLRDAVAARHPNAFDRRAA